MAPPAGARGAGRADAPKKRGRPTTPGSPLARRVAELERDKARLERRLQQAEAIIDAQKKLSEVLGLCGPETASRSSAERRGRARGARGVPAGVSGAGGQPRHGVSAASAARPAGGRPRPPRALTAAERAAVLAQLHSPRFVDRAPREVYATLLDEGRYLCSPRTMYRLLAAADESRERRNQLRHVAPPPELLATRPNEVWSWDITKLLGPAKWTYYYLYVILDIFSRYVVGWMVAHGSGPAWPSG